MECPRYLGRAALGLKAGLDMHNSFGKPFERRVLSLRATALITFPHDVLFWHGRSLS
jgi:hypothetical protein